jgi:hypothetical protein
VQVKINLVTLAKISTLLGFAFILGSCSGASESAIAKKITLSVSSSAVVLPNTLDATVGQTCNGAGVSGPRVRLRATLEWDGDTNLVPLVLRMYGSDSRLSGDINVSVSSSDSSKESIAYYFLGTGTGATDYFPKNVSTSYSTSTCFFDYGSLPKPTTTLTGTSQLQIPVTVQLMGVSRDDSGNETPFIKEIQTSIIYAAGSVPST